MPIELFGFSIGRVDKDKEEKKRKSFTLPATDDGSLEVAPAGGAFGQYIDLEGTAKHEADLIARYRTMAVYPECDNAIDDIINEAVVTSREEPPVTLSLEKAQLSENIEEKIRTEFKEIIRLLDFDNIGYDMFRRWYVDGRLYFHLIIDEKNPSKGILELRPVDPLKIKKIRQPRLETTHRGVVGVDTSGFDEFYIFNDKGLSPTSETIGGAVGGMGVGENIKISIDSISYSHSGMLSPDKRMVFSHLNKAIKPMNQLRMIEDAVVIYRISRAPERRIFYIDVGNLPKIKAEQYLRDIMTRYKNKLVYDANTGEIKDDRRFQTMLEDYWLPRREGGRGTEITTLPGGENLGELADVEYFQKKLYKSLNVPSSRLEQDSGFVLGRAEEISRDEVKFTRFIERLRARFALLFDDLLEKQLLLKGVASYNDWQIIKQGLSYDWQSDSHFAELKEATMLRERLGILGEMGIRDGIIGEYYSKDYVKKRILRLTAEEIEAMEIQIEDEKAAGGGEGEDEQKSMSWDYKHDAKLKVIDGRN